MKRLFDLLRPPSKYGGLRGALALDRYCRDLHCIPVKDKHPHMFCRACTCKPTVTYAGHGFFVLHRSWDEREYNEEAFDDMTGKYWIIFPKPTEDEDYRRHREDFDRDYEQTCRRSKRTPHDGGVDPLPDA